MLSMQRANTNHKESIKQCFMTIFDETELKYFNRIRDFSLSYVGLDRNKAVKAFILVNESEEIADYEIAYLGVSTRYRGKGYSKILMQLVLDNLSTHTLWLNTFNDNLTACKLYEKMGFYRIDETNSKEIVYIYDGYVSSSPK